jgi:hypothetical protein
LCLALIWASIGDLQPMKTWGKSQVFRRGPKRLQDFLAIHTHFGLTTSLHFKAKLLSPIHHQLSLKHALE